MRRIRVQGKCVFKQKAVFFTCSLFERYLVLPVYLGKRVHHVFQKTAWILAGIVIIMFRGAIARQWTLSEKNAGKAVGYAR